MLQVAVEKEKTEYLGREHYQRREGGASLMWRDAVSRRTHLLVKNGTWRVYDEAARTSEDTGCAAAIQLVHPARRWPIADRQCPLSPTRRSMTNAGPLVDTRGLTLVAADFYRNRVYGMDTCILQLQQTDRECVGMRRVGSFAIRTDVSPRRWVPSAAGWT